MCAVSLGSAAQLPDYVPTDGLVAWYPLDGNVEAEGEGSQDGLNFGAQATEDRNGNSSSAMLFVSTELDRVELGHGFATGNQPKSFAFWVRSDVLKYQWILSGGDGDANGEAFGLFQDPAAAPTSLVFHGNSLTYDFYFSSLEIQVWTHVAIVYNGNTVRAYLNGEFIDSKEVSLDTGSDQIWLGARNNGLGNGSYFSGAIDNVGIWSIALTDEHVLGLYHENPGCTDETACNFDSEATTDDGSCYSCDIPESHCGPGTSWDAELQMCIGDGSGDINNDGCVQLNDLLDLLSAYGNCGAEESAWQCGDPLEYQGHGYETVQIGEQCWFAENLRAENYKNGDFISANLDNSEWTSTTSGATVFYGDDVSSLQAYGRLYNWHAVDDSRGLCPNAWRIPSDGDWTVLTDFLGGSATAGAQMKTTDGWNGDGDGANSSGFSGVPGGSRASNGNFYLAGSSGYWWSATPYGSSAWYRTVSYNDDSVNRNFAYHRNGYSVRCVRDAQ